MRMVPVKGKILEGCAAFDMTACISCELRA